MNRIFAVFGILLQHMIKAKIQSVDTKKKLKLCLSMFLCLCIACFRLVLTPNQLKRTIVSKDVCAPTKNQKPKKRVSEHAATICSKLLQSV